LLIHALVAKIWPNKVVRWCPYGNFWRLFCVLCFQEAACSRFQTCMLNLQNLHEGHTMCGSMADIQSVAAEIRRGKKERRRTNHSMKIQWSALFHRVTIIIISDVARCPAFMPSTSLCWSICTEVKVLVENHKYVLLCMCLMVPSVL